MDKIIQSVLAIGIIAIVLGGVAIPIFEDSANSNTTLIVNQDLGDAQFVDPEALDDATIVFSNINGLSVNGTTIPIGRYLTGSIISSNGYIVKSPGVGLPTSLILHPLSAAPITVDLATGDCTVTLANGALTIQQGETSYNWGTCEWASYPVTDSSKGHAVLHTNNRSVPFYVNDYDQIYGIKVASAAISTNNQSYNNVIVHGNSWTINGTTYTSNGLTKDDRYTNCLYKSIDTPWSANTDEITLASGDAIVAEYTLLPSQINVTTEDQHNLNTILGLVPLLLVIALILGVVATVFARMRDD